MKHGLAIALAMLSVTTVAADLPAAPSKADPAKGQQIVAQVCAACHGNDGNSSTPANPSLAGQSASYIATQLGYFKNGTRKSPVMKTFADALSQDDVKNVAAYFEKQPPKPQAAKDKALAEQGQKLYRSGNTEKGVPACTACHGPTGAGIPSQFPRLAGQHADYTFGQLRAFNNNERGSGNAAMMRAVAAKLSEPEMKALAEYIAGLR